MTRRALIVILSVILSSAVAQKCKTVNLKGGNQAAQCENVGSMNDIAGEIKKTWTSIKIVNDAQHGEFSLTSVNVPHLNVINSLDLSCVGTLKNIPPNGFSDSYDALQTLDISSTNINVLNTLWFQKRNIEVLNVSKNAISDIKKDNFKFLNKLKVFNASHNQIKTVELNSFVELKKLESITLNNNQLAFIAFDSLENVKIINLRQNFIPTIFHYTFIRCLRLAAINIAENLLTGIVDGSFSTLESLQYLDVSNNKLPYIGAYTFLGCSKTKLYHLDLSFNAITLLQTVCFSELPLLTYLDVSNNKIAEINIQTFEKQAKLQKLKLNNNRIEKIASKSFVNLLQLRLLDLSFNKLTVFNMDMFGGDKFKKNQLKQINLSNNDLTKLDAALFAVFGSQLTSLDVSFNNFRTISANSLKSNVELQQLLIQSNKIDFLDNNFLAPFKDLQEFNFDSNRLTFIPSTDSLKKSTATRKFSIGNNPLQCACLREFIIWARSNNVEVENMKSSSENPDCVIVSDAACLRVKEEIEPHDLYNKYTDGLLFHDSERSDFSFK